MKFPKHVLLLSLLLVSTFFISNTAFAVAPTASNLSAAETYTEDTSLNLVDIVASDSDSTDITATLTLSSPAVGSLTTGTSNTVTSTYNAGTGVWTASGAIADVNTLLAGVTFIPVSNGNSNFTIATSISDGVLSVTGNKSVTGIAINDAPTATNLSVAELYANTVVSTRNLVDIVVSDIDSANVTATLTLSNPAAGSLSTATSGTVTSTYVAGTGVWTASGAIANVNILLAGVSFTNTSGFGSSFTITTNVSDGALSVSGSKAFTLNHSPSLDASKTPTMTTIFEDAAAPSGAVGELISSLVDFASPTGQVDNVTDADASAPLGIAIRSVDSNLTCYYSLNGGSSWSAVAPVSLGASRLLAADNDNRIYCMPAANVNGSFAAFTFLAWDQTTGTDGGTGASSPSGGSTSFSTSTDTVSLTVTAVNDAPVLDTSKTPTMTTLAEDAGAPSGAVGTPISNLVDATTPAGGLDNVTDADTGSSYGIAITATDANVTCYYSTDSGSTWSLIDGVSSSGALLLAANATNRVYCQPNPDANGIFADAITFRAWDQTSGSDGGTADTTTNGGVTAFSSAADGVSLTVTAVNDAPILDASKTPVMFPVAQDASAPVGAVGTSVTSFVDSAASPGGFDNVTDVDSGALSGIAITAADSTNMTYYYSLNSGATWSALGAVSNTSARLLAAKATNRIYGQPAPSFNGTVSSAITFRAWDQTSGSDGGLASTATSGGTSAFSTATDTASLTVTGANTAPVATDDAYTIDEDAPGQSQDELSNDTDANSDALTIVSVTTPDEGGAAVIINGGQHIGYSSAANFCGTEHFDYTISDGNGGTDTATVTMTITCVNDAPIAVDDAFNILENSAPTGLFVLNNDTDPEDDTLSLVSVTSPNHGGAASISGDAIIYTPATDFFGTETFSYTVSDGHGGADTGTVSIDVALVDNTAPDTFITSSSTPSIDSGTATFEFSANEQPATFECAIDTGGGPVFTACTSPFTSTLFLPGNQYMFLVRAKDAVGNVDDTPASIPWRVSNVAVSSVFPANGSTKVSVNTPIVFHFAAPVPEDLVRHTGNTAGPCDVHGCPTLDGIWSDNFTTLTYTNEDGPFNKNTTYTVNLLTNNGLMDGTLYTESFTTVANSPSTVGGHIIEQPKTPVVQGIPVITPERFHFPRTLKFGLQGDDVVMLQKILGITPPPSKHFGALTKVALIKYQKAHGLGADGVAGPKTFAVIEAEMNK